MVSRRKQCHYTACTEYCLKKTFGICKEPKVIIHKLKNTLPESTKHWRNISTTFGMIATEYKPDDKDGYSFGATVTQKMAQNPGKVNLRKKWGIFKDVKVVLYRLNTNCSLSDLQTVTCSATVSQSDDNPPNNVLSEEEDQHTWEKEIRPNKLMTGNLQKMDYVITESDISIQTENGVYVNPMDIDETIREERIIRLKKLVKEHDKKVEAIRRKLKTNTIF